MTGKPKNENIKIALFDLGGVIFQLDWNRSAQAYGLGNAHKPEEIEALWNWPVFQTFERGGMDADDFRKRFSERLGISLDCRKFDLAWNSLIAGVFPGIENLLSQLAIPAYAMTNTNPIHFAHITKQYPVMSFFKNVYASHLMKLRKPEPAVFQTILTELHLLPGEVLFFDDLPANVAAAQSVGITAKVIKNPVEDLTAALSPYFKAAKAG